MSKTLIIDPGHGGTDPGANGFGVKEKDWTLKISLYQYNRLKELGAKVAITRTTDKTLDSGPRTDLIKGKYDYCMSNHFNAFNGSARGVETIYSIYSTNTIAKRLADVIVATSKLPLRRVFKREGKAGDYYFMHRLTGSTQTIIVEYGFIDNKTDHDFYKNENNFYKVAEAVVEEWCSILGIKYIAPGQKEVSEPEAGKPITKPTVTKTNADNYTGNSIVDYLNLKKIDSSFANRKKLATQHGIKGYTGTASQNLQLLNKLRGGSAKVSKAKKSINQMATEVIQGKHGNGHANRRKSLGISQAEYNKVRAEVNRRL